jgi:hypothetical protein
LRNDSGSIRRRRSPALDKCVLILASSSRRWFRDSPKDLSVRADA